MSAPDEDVTMEESDSEIEIGDTHETFGAAVDCLDVLVDGDSDEDEDDDDDDDDDDFEEEDAEEDVEEDAKKAAKAAKVEEDAKKAAKAAKVEEDAKKAEKAAKVEEGTKKAEKAAKVEEGAKAAEVGGGDLDENGNEDAPSQFKVFGAKNRKDAFYVPNCFLRRNYKKTIKMTKADYDKVRAGQVSPWPTSNYPLKAIVVVMAHGRQDNPAGGFVLSKEVMSFWFASILQQDVPEDQQDLYQLIKLPRGTVRKIQGFISTDKRLESSSLATFHKEMVGDIERDDEKWFFDPSVQPDHDRWTRVVAPGSKLSNKSKPKPKSTPVPNETSGTPTPKLQLVVPQPKTVDELPDTETKMKMPPASNAASSAETAPDGSNEQSKTKPDESELQKKLKLAKTKRELAQTKRELAQTKLVALESAAAATKATSEAEVEESRAAAEAAEAAIASASSIKKEEAAAARRESRKAAALRKKEMVVGAGKLVDEAVPSEAGKLVETSGKRPASDEPDRPRAKRGPCGNTLDVGEMSLLASVSLGSSPPKVLALINAETNTYDIYVSRP